MTQQHSLFSYPLTTLFKRFAVSVKWICSQKPADCVGKPHAASSQNIFSLTYFLIA